MSRDAINTFISNAKKNYAITPGKQEQKSYKYYVAPTSKIEGAGLPGTNWPLSWRPSAAKRDDRFRLDRAYIDSLESEISNRTHVDTPQPSKKASQIHGTNSSVTKPIRRTYRAEPSSLKTSPPVQVYNVREAFDEEDSGSKEADDRFSEISGVRENRLEEIGEDQENMPVGNQAVVLTRPDYYTVPSLHELLLDEKGMCLVEDFTVGRYSYGNIQFLGMCDGGIFDFQQNRL